MISCAYFNKVGFGSVLISFVAPTYPARARPRRECGPKMGGAGENHPAGVLQFAMKVKIQSPPAAALNEGSSVFKIAIPTIMHAFPKYQFEPFMPSMNKQQTCRY